MRRPLGFTLLVLPLLLIGLACQNPDSAGSAEADTTDAIPFTKEGRLTFLQNGDSTVTIDLEIADTDSARERGMMQRTGFPNDRSGMLFPFEEEQPQSFWMSNTPVALDILFADADSQIVSIAKYTTPFSTERYRSGDPAQYVVEVPAGFADSHGILEGDRIRWRRVE
ncbi:DUF192 domain-containing protein [Salinibacter grassmerensis]|uniref:DUF192 domain-containing protein n=1 Tax=Salinibacter grassmerensis TaxID=3040353 RepID=UPI0021E764A9|nr:DUF192 domain-containing protein [Salinibacter grassmerensis]